MGDDGTPAAGSPDPSPRFLAGAPGCTGGTWGGPLPLEEAQIWGGVAVWPPCSLFSILSLPPTSSLLLPVYGGGAPSVSISLKNKRARTRGPLSFPGPLPSRSSPQPRPRPLCPGARLDPLPFSQSQQDPRCTGPKELGCPCCSPPPHHPWGPLPRLKGTLYHTHVPHFPWPGRETGESQWGGQRWPAPGTP